MKGHDEHGRTSHLHRPGASPAPPGLTPLEPEDPTEVGPYPFAEVLTLEEATETPMEDPQVWAAENDGFGWSVVRAPICGTVRFSDSLAMNDANGQKEWDVQASGWGMDCDYAMEIAKLRENPSLEPDRGEFLHGSRGTRSGIWRYDDSMACGLFWNEAIGADGFAMPTYTYSPCQEATVLSLGEEMALYKESEVDFGPVTLIDFHERA